MSILPEVLRIDAVEQADQIDLSHITDEKIKGTITELITKYHPEKTVDVGVKMKIILTDEIPVSQRPRRLACVEREKVKKHLEQLEEENIIRVSNSDYASPIVVVYRKNGDIRVCVDFRQLNKNY
jgi:hypothetical protein